MKFTSAGFEIDLLGKTITIPASLWRFVLVGGLGTVVNMIIYYLLSTYLSLPLILCSILAFAVAVTENYLINQTWSFRQESDTKRSAKSYLQYVPGKSPEFGIQFHCVIWIFNDFRSKI